MMKSKSHGISKSNSLYALLDLMKQMIVRDVMMRYKGSYFGVLWSLVTPLVMLFVYTFVFSVVFKARWGDSVSGNQAEYALLLFVGLIMFNVFSEMVNRAPNLVLSHANYVTKVVFPLEILSIVSLGNALLHSLISLLVLLVGQLVFYGELHWTLLYLPLIYLPLSFCTVGVSWILSSLGVFLRDLHYFVAILVQVLFFMTPIFYPVSAVPKDFQVFLGLNPMSGLIENARQIILIGEPPDWGWLIQSTLLSVVIMLVGLYWFRKTKKAFADVI